MSSEQLQYCENKKEQEMEIEKLVSSNSKFKNYFMTYYYSNHNKNNQFISKQLNSPDSNKLTVRHQVTFLLDITGSMEPLIKGTKEQVIKLIDTLKTAAENEIPNENKEKTELIFEVSVIGYRDFTDVVHFQTKDFTDNINAIKEFLNNIKAEGGDDDPEDVKGAFIHALFGINDKSKRLSWDDHGEIAGRSILWIADCPPHGCKFVAKKFQDNYSNDSVEEWDTIFEELNKLDIELYLVKITNKTQNANIFFKELGKKFNVTIREIDISQYVDTKKCYFDSKTGYEHISGPLSTDYCYKTSMYISKSTSIVNKSESPDTVNQISEVNNITVDI